MESKTYFLRDRDQLKPTERKVNNGLKCRGLEILSEVAKTRSKEKPQQRKNSSSLSIEEVDAVTELHDEEEINVSREVIVVETSTDNSSRRQTRSKGRNRRTELPTEKMNTHRNQSQSPKKALLQNAADSFSPQEELMGQEEISWKEVVWKDLGVDQEGREVPDWREVLRKYGVPLEQIEILM